jgi:MFS family permease
MSVPDRLRASGLGWYNTTVGLLGLVASVVAGLLWDHVGHAAVFLYGAVIGSIALLALLPAKQIRRAPNVASWHIADVENRSMDVR